MWLRGEVFDTPPRTPYDTSDCEHDPDRLQAQDPEDRPESDGSRCSNARCGVHRFSASDPDPVPITAAACNNSQSATIRAAGIWPLTGNKSCHTKRVWLSISHFNVDNAFESYIYGSKERAGIIELLRENLTLGIYRYFVLPIDHMRGRSENQKVRNQFPIVTLDTGYHLSGRFPTIAISTCAALASSVRMATSRV